MPVLQEQKQVRPRNHSPHPEARPPGSRAVQICSTARDSGNAVIAGANNGQTTLSLASRINAKKAVLF